MQSHSRYKMPCVTPCLAEEHQAASHRPPRRGDPALKGHKLLSVHGADRHRAELSQDTSAFPQTRRGTHGSTGSEELLSCQTSTKELLVSLAPAADSKGSWAVSTLTTANRSCTRNPHSVERVSSHRVESCFLLSLCSLSSPKAGPAQGGTGLLFGLHNDASREASRNLKFLSSWPSPR